MALAPDDPRHGKASTYQRYACRCDACREAERIAVQAYRDAHREEVNAAGRDYRRRNFRKVQEWERKRRTAHQRGATSAAHGTRSRYVTGCRCQQCRAACAAYMRQRRSA